MESNQQAPATSSWWQFTALAALTNACRPGKPLWGYFLAPFQAGKIQSYSGGSSGSSGSSGSGGVNRTGGALAALFKPVKNMLSQPSAPKFGELAADPGVLAADAGQLVAAFLREQGVLLEGSGAGAAAAVVVELEALVSAHGALAVLTQLRSAAHAQGLAVNGLPLQPARFEERDWAPGQILPLTEDPDRTAMPWTAPAFIREQDPAAQQARTRVEELTPRLGQIARGSFARVVHGVLTEAQCAALLASVNAKGFTPALLNIGGGDQMLAPDARDGHRIIVDSAEVAAYLYKVLEPHIPGKLRGSLDPVELNERCRFLCYTPGQEFAAHCDGAYRRPEGHPRQGDCSKVTVQLYLHDVPEANGGATTFNPDTVGEPVPCQPRAGSVLLFTQDLYHEGSRVNAGLKYTMRTEVMYSFN